MIFTFLITVFVSQCIGTVFVSAQECGSPRFSLNLDLECAELDTVNIDYVPEDYIAYRCKTLLIRTSAKLDYCPVEVCSNGNWSSASISCGNTECYTNSQAYDGRRVCTVTGRTCQRWDSQTPNSHNYTASELFPDDNATEASNYCRDPGGVKGQPWCYTTDPALPWDYCGIADCSAINITQGLCPGNYCGDILNGISTDNTCLYIAPVSASYDRSVGTKVPYECVSLLEGFQSAISYCPVRACQEDFFWSNVSLSCGENECYTLGDSVSYQGRRECTINGLQCQEWSSQSPHPHSYTSLTDFPDANDTARGAHCRDPGNARGQPWCYTTDPSVEWEYCGLPSCADMVANSGTCSSTNTGSTTTTATMTTGATTTAAATAATTTTVTTVSPTATATTLAATTTTGPASMTTSAATHSRERSMVYQNIPARAGFDLQWTIPYLSSATSCCRQCSETQQCVLVTYNSGTCNLFKENPANVANLDCTVPQKCYLIQELV